MLSTESHSLSLPLLIRLTVTLAPSLVFIPQMELLLNKDIHYNRGTLLVPFCFASFVHNRDVTSLLECAAGCVTLLFCAYLRNSDVNSKSNCC